MAEVIIMPKLGFNMEEGQLVKWHKSEGDSITKGELFFEINTDKTNMPVEATLDGVVLKIMLEEGETAPVFTPIAVVGQAGEDYAAALNVFTGAAGADAADDSDSGSSTVAPSSAADSDLASTSVLPSAAAGASAPGYMKLTPRAKKYLADNNIDPAEAARIEGTGFAGGITEADIKASPLARKAAAQTGVALSGLEGGGPGGKIMKADVEKAAAQNQPCDGLQILYTAPYKGVRKIIGEKLSFSMQQSPHIYFTDSVDTAPMAEFRNEVSEALGEKISVTDILAIAASRALTKYPGVNSSLIDGAIVTYRSTNIGVAVAGDNGLIVPVIKNVQEKTISEVAKISRDLIDRARAGSLSPDEYSGGTFTISNLGMFGIENFTAIINPPEAAILAVSAAKKKPVVITAGEEDKIVIKSMMSIQLSVDHRLIDGLLAARFVAYIKELLENPLRILL